MKANEIDQLNSKEEFCIYKGTKNKNILFLGSCRLSPLMYYLNLLRPEFNIFCIYVPFWDSNPEKEFPREKIQEMLGDTDTIVTETIANNPILNTKGENNFFNNFSCQEKNEIRLPNYMLSLYLYDILNLNIVNSDIDPEENKEAIKKAFQESKTRMENSIKKAGLDPVNDFFNEHFSNIKMYSTINHPTTIVSMLTFKLIAEKLGAKPSIDFMRDVSKNHFLSGNSTPVTEFDMETHEFRFKTRVFDKEVLKKKGYYYHPGEEEEIPEGHIKIIMSEQYSLKQ